MNLAVVLDIPGHAGRSHLTGDSTPERVVEIGNQPFFRLRRFEQTAERLRKRRRMRRFERKAVREFRLRIPALFQRGDPVQVLLAEDPEIRQLRRRSAETQHHLPQLQFRHPCLPPGCNTWGSGNVGRLKATAVFAESARKSRQRAGALSNGRQNIGGFPRPPAAQMPDSQSRIEIRPLQHDDGGFGRFPRNPADCPRQVSVQSRMQFHTPACMQFL